MHERVIDIDGQIINEPLGYSECVEAIRVMIDNLEDKGVDRSDINVVLTRVMFEANFHLMMLPSRQRPTRGEKHGS